MKPRFVVCCALLCFCTVAVVISQDAAKVDAQHYKVESENSQVRILRFHYGPHEKSVMHSHPNSVVVYLTDGKARFHFADGKTQDVDAKAGGTDFVAAMTHDPENIGDKAFDGILVELK